MEEEEEGGVESGGVSQVGEPEDARRVWGRGGEYLRKE